jgi:hypothetical protein
MINKPFLNFLWFINILEITPNNKWEH